MTESELQSAILEMARWEGFLAFHVYDSRKSTGPGFPDLVLCHPRTGRLLFVELKSASGKTTADQDVWLDALAAGGAEVFVWRPEHWQSGAIQQVLRIGRRRVA